MTQHWNEADVRLHYTNRDTCTVLKSGVRISFVFSTTGWLQPWASTSRLTIKDTELYLPVM